MSRKAGTGIIKKEDQVLKESMVYGSAEARHLGMRAEPFILKGGGGEEQTSSRKERGSQWRGLRLDGSKQCNERSVPRKEVGLWSRL